MSPNIQHATVYTWQGTCVILQSISREVGDQPLFFQSFQPDCKIWTSLQGGVGKRREREGLWDFAGKWWCSTPTPSSCRWQCQRILDPSTRPERWHTSHIHKSECHHTKIKPLCNSRWRKGRQSHLGEELRISESIIDTASNPYHGTILQRTLNDCTSWEGPPRSCIEKPLKCAFEMSRK